jgi:hypothetical protein
VEWTNQHGETKAPYDIKLVSRSGGLSSTVFVEVKSTRSHDRNLFELSLGEWEFMSREPVVPYHIYRVYDAGDRARTRIMVIEDPVQLLKEGRMKLCLAA